jgi:hypothetical protein
MNAANALIFAVLGSAMEILPRLFPGWIAHQGGDCGAARALWLAVMGTVQIGLGLGYLVRAHLVPLSVRLLSSAPVGDAEAIALSTTRSATGH